jgi:hypothetical protein
MEEQDTTQVEEDVIEESLPSEEIEETEELAADSEQESEEESDDEPVEEKPKKALQKRFSEMTAARRNAEAERDAVLKQNQEILARLERTNQPARQEQEAPRQAPTPPGLPPDRYDFDNDEQFQTAIGKYQENSVNYQRHLVREELKADRDQTQQRTFQEQAEVAKREIGTKLKTISETGAKAYADFNDVAFIPNDVAAFVANETKHASEIAYYWGQNPDAREEISRMVKVNPYKAAAEIARLDERFANKRQSNAPPPPKPLGGSNKGAVDPDKLPIDEWIKLREAGKIK